MRRRALESPKVRPPNAPPSLPPPGSLDPFWVLHPAPLRGGGYFIPVLERRLPGAEEGRRGASSHYGSYNRKRYTRRCEALFGIVSLTGKKWAGCLAAPTMESALKASIMRGNLPQASRAGRLLCLTQNSRRNIPEIGNRKKWAAARA